MEQKESYIWTEILKFCILVIIFSFISTLLNRQSMSNAISFLLFQIFAVLIPGISVLLVFKIKFQSNIELIGVSYLLGYVYNIVIYICLVPCGLQKLMLPTFFVGAIIGSIYLYKMKNTIILERDKKGEVICGVILVSLLLLEQVVYSGANMLVPATSENIYYNDLLYWIGNTISLTKQFPPIDFRIFPNHYNYHYFSSLQLATICITTGIRPIVVSFCYSFIQPIFLLTCGSYCLFRKCSSKKLLVLIGVVGVLFTTGIEPIAFVSYVPHMYLGSFGFDYGMGILCFLLYFMIQQHQKDVFDLKLFALVITLFGILSGTKAPIAAIALCGLGMLCICWLFQRRWLKAFGYGGFLLVIFVLSYIFITNMKGYGGSITNVLSGGRIFESNDSIFAIRGIFEALQGYHIPKIIREVLFAGVYTIIANPFIFGMFWITCAAKIIYIHKCDALDIACIFATLMAAILTLYVNMNGYSQMYFIMSCYPITLIFIIRALNSVEQYNLYRKKNIFFCGISCLLIVGIFNWFRGCEVNGYIGTIPYYFEYGVKNYMNQSEVKEMDIYSKFEKTYTNKEHVEGYDFIRENTDINEAIACSRASMIEGVYTERYMINRTDILENENYAGLKELTKQGITYFMQEKDSEFTDTGNVIIPDSYGTVVFENNAVRIYQLRNE